MNSFAVIGLGRFGMMLARTLAKAGREVIAVDTDRELVESVQNDVTVAVRLDGTDERALRGQGLDKVDCAIVSIGETFEANTLATALLKSIGIKWVIARAATPIRQKILRLVGADQIISPEDESAIRLAQRLIAPNILSFLEIGEGVSMVQMQAPPKFHNKKLVELGLREKYSVNLVAIKKKVVTAGKNGEKVIEEKILDIPKPSDVIEPDDILILMGHDQALADLPNA
ncbi:MAG TPA: TrkA family potassium uptake protein [Planctomycetota bacterium]|nr:TrkA family potassium uptake protein [Planctomycetota bacterium]HUV38936.1 TrkA family potassium uptake protein [Planctomycetota bacterium]